MGEWYQWWDGTGHREALTGFGPGKPYAAAKHVGRLAFAAGLAEAARRDEGLRKALGQLRTLHRDGYTKELLAELGVTEWRGTLSEFALEIIDAAQPLPQAEERT